VAVRDRRIRVNPARDINLPRKTKKPRTYLTRDQVSALALASGEHSTLVLVLSYTGLRWGEAIGLQVGDLNMLRRRIQVERNAVEVGTKIEIGTPKTGESRSVPFPAGLATALAWQCEGKTPTDLVFRRDDGSHLRRTRGGGSSRAWFARAIVASGLPPLTPHDLRHTAASLAISSGANVLAVQRMLGHASAKMTLDTYADLFDDDLDHVAGRMDEGLRSTIVGKMWAEEAAS